MTDPNRTPDEARPASPADGPTSPTDGPTARPQGDDRSETAAYPAVREGASAPAQDTRPVTPAPAGQPLLEPAADGPAPPKRQSNRVVGTAWVLLAAGLFQVVYAAAIAGLVTLLAGPELIGPQLAQYAPSPFAWLPVLFFFLLFELTVLIFNRAGRFLYVVASLVVGALVYVLTVVLITTILGEGPADRATLQQAFLNPLFVLTGLVAREVMLWTGVAIGARGTRLRKRNRAAKESYRAELAKGELAEGRNAA